MEQTFTLPIELSAYTKLKNTASKHAYVQYPNLKEDFEEEKSRREFQTQSAPSIGSIEDTFVSYISKKSSILPPMYDNCEGSDSHSLLKTKQGHIGDASYSQFDEADNSCEEQYDDKSTLEPDVSNDTLCMECIKPMKVYSEKDIQAGDHIVFSNSGVYHHHAIVVRTFVRTEEQVDIEIVHAAHTMAGESIYSRYYSFGRKARVMKVEKRVRLKDRNIAVVKYNSNIRLFSADEIVRRAESEAHQDSEGGPTTFKYELLRNNCEHFATWCVTGKKLSLKEPKSTMVVWMFFRTGFAAILDENKKNENEYEVGMICSSCYERNKAVINVEKRKILKQTDVNYGDIITYRYYTLWHNAVVLNVHKKETNYMKCDIAHYAYCGPFQHRTIVKEQLLIPFDGSVNVLVYPAKTFQTYSAHEVVTRAEQRINEQEFAIFSNNSSQFARWCKLI